MLRGRLRRRFGRLRGAPSPDEARLGFIRTHAAGRSFAEIGGLFRLHGEHSFIAEAEGASTVTLLDAGDADKTEFWQRHRERHSSVRFVQGDLEDPQAIAEVGAHDLVYCCGVIYHTPNPVAQLMQLRRITRELLYLSSMTIPELPGHANACIYYPHLPEADRGALARPHGPRGGDFWAIGTPFVDRPMLGHGNFWWGITPSALVSMLRTAAFEPVEVIKTWQYPYATHVIARPLERDPALPPVSYYRQRARARAQGRDVPFADYYERSRSGQEVGIEAAPGPFEDRRESADDWRRPN